MRSGLSFDNIFPVRNEASAQLMRLKADCLLESGVIEAEDWLSVYARTAAVLGFRELESRAGFAARAEQSPSTSRRRGLALAQVRNW
jgi:hypothetical protein